MEGKVTLEEHWAIEETLGSNLRIAGVSDWLKEVHRRLQDVQDQRPFSRSDLSVRNR